MTIGDTLAAPPPGSTTVGDMYVDLGTKTIWLGVDTAVDPSGAVLVSDIMSIQPTIDAALVSANAFTTAGLATKAALAHTHTASQITDFTAAVNAIVGGGGASGFVNKMVMMYSGSLADIGTGALANWALCDGTNGTPNLKDRIVMGAGNSPPGQTQPNTTLNMTTAGAHVHTVNGHVLTLAEMANHQHSGTFAGSGSGGTDVQGDHQHQTLGGTGGNPGNGYASLNVGNNQNAPTTVAGAHSHNVSVSVVVSGTVGAVGGNAAHDHTMTTSGAHVHAVTTADLRNAMPYYTLAFIMKL